MRRGYPCSLFLIWLVKLTTAIPTSFGSPFRHQNNNAPDVHVKWMAAPINPSDLNQIEGAYPIRPDSFPAVAGNEGVGRIVEVLTSGTSLCKGDWVIPVSPGTWREESFVCSNDLIKVDNTLPLAMASMLHVNPCTAYRLLDDFSIMKPGISDYEQPDPKHRLSINPKWSKLCRRPIGDSNC
ncbi:putative zn2+-binding dehydrogenase nuclear receptor binding factor-1 [Mitosporidium daphniae]|uniref:Putative zn2+-binding dehydrogenase nuclear receptor binding factor-1 n=1 Tax=Mitosporidium daphniae TaxID=1485682 RepID=A0A098VZ75_9MICR|nr:putative zn2+-binding dehydrogenase nuclear receptor binding factor-1 [Mitosporidium daphniae]KGG53046.1 putative zn2+-binding dehydrogenase nuclear receptor binding factor-1 [Mitosporidium daphniae]|eukprot:XP_013239482.1 putative zn2+-binding dehydrogenase nuclear receptor binding factor-1 [Mitosporidium daphniae]